MSLAKAPMAKDHWPVVILKFLLGIVWVSTSWFGSEYSVDYQFDNLHGETIVPMLMPCSMYRSSKICYFFSIVFSDSWILESLMSLLRMSLRCIKSIGYTWVKAVSKTVVLDAPCYSNANDHHFDHHMKELSCLHIDMTPFLDWFKLFYYQFKHIWKSY